MSKVHVTPTDPSMAEYLEQEAARLLAEQDLVAGLKLQIDREATRVLLRAAAWRAEGVRLLETKSFGAGADSMVVDVARAIAVRMGSVDPYLLSIELQALKEIL